jgi:cytochrome b
MRNTLVYDLPTRLFHWLFSSLFLFSFVVAKTIDDESLLYSYHMISGLLLGGLVIWRIFWGFFGTTHARFTGFHLNPGDLLKYFRGVISGSKERWTGHNPASSWASISFFLLALGMVTTGFLMTAGNKETFEDIHEVIANSFIVIAFVHIAGVIFHSIRHRDLIALSMLDGRKALDNKDLPIRSSRPLSAILLVLLFISGAFFLLKGFNTQDRTLPIGGQTLQLGENEKNESVGEKNDGKLESEDYD